VAQILDPAPKEALAHNWAPAEGSWTSAVAVHLGSEGTVLVGRRVGMLDDAAAALVGVLRSCGRFADVVGS
jgi:hypothetical protein